MSVRSSTNQDTIVFAGGGTGGHISPGLAIAERLHEIAPGTSCVFLCSDRDVDAMMLTEAGASFTPVPAMVPSIRPVAAIRFALRHRKCVQLASQSLRRVKATQVVSLGGFVTAPVVAAARREGIPVTLVNLDVVPGRANRWIARHASRLWTAVPTAEDWRVVGFPVRQGAIAVSDAVACRERLGLAASRPTLLVTGASQGAGTINEVMPLLRSLHPEWFDGWQILHLAGPGRDATVRQSYGDASAVHVIPFVHRMGDVWGAADLAISRSGASSVAEAMINRVPTVFLPYPYHADQHQRLNALPWVERGAAWLMEDVIDVERNARCLGEILEPLIRPGSPGLDAARAAIDRDPPPDAASSIASMLLDDAGLVG